MTAIRSPRAARNALDRALLGMADDGQKPRCGEFGNHAVWLSEEPRLRAQAATWCAGCPVLPECDAAATEGKATFGVWAGKDRTGTPRGGAR